MKQVWNKPEVKELGLVSTKDEMCYCTEGAASTISADGAHEYKPGNPCPPNGPHKPAKPGFGPVGPVTPELDATPAIS